MTRNLKIIAYIEEEVPMSTELSIDGTLCSHAVTIKRDCKAYDQSIAQYSLVSTDPIYINPRLGHAHSIYRCQLNCPLSARRLLYLLHTLGIAPQHSTHNLYPAHICIGALPDFLWPYIGV